MRKENNHYYPLLHIRNWLKQTNYKLFDKNMNSNRPYIRKKDFAIKFYYSLGKEDSTLEDNLSKFEQYISKIIDKIKNSKCNINLSLKEIELLKLYCVFAACRQHFTTEVIKLDPTGIYQSNDYIVGTHRILTQEEVVKTCENIYIEFERIKQMDDGALNKALNNSPFNSLSDFTYGLHLNIFKNNKNSLCASDKCTIIENTMDSNHLFVYIPISPNRALMLIKTKYYKDKETYKTYLKFLGELNYATHPDEWISAIFSEDNANFENLLFPTYKIEKNNWMLKIQALPNNIVEKFNSIFYEDGDLILYVNDKDLEHAKTHQLNCREIEVAPYTVITKKLN